MAHLLKDAAQAAQNIAQTIHNYGDTAIARGEQLKNGFDLDLPDVKKPHAEDNRPTITQGLLSYLGSKNPFAHQITKNDTVWLLDNTAYRNPTTNEFEAEFVAAVFDQNTGVEVSSVVAAVASRLGLGSGCAEEATIRERLMPIMQTILPGRVVKVEYPRAKQLRLGPGGRNAISSDIKQLPKFNGGDVVPSAATVPQGANGILRMKTVYAEPEGWGVISDIDDTIKITLTSDPIGILRSTFVSEPTPIAGMPELYTYIQSLISTTAPFFYLSASPYNLYPFLRGFREAHYPQGTMILRDASWMNLAGLFENLTLGVQEYKVDRMTKVNSWLPRRKMICIGDSTQKDPESYGEIYRKHNGWVGLILIRKVTDIAAVGIQEKNEPARFEKAFEGLPKDVWHVFEHPEECYEIIKKTVGR